MSLTYRDRGNTETHFDVLCGSLRVGMIYKAVASVGTSRAPHWQWTFFVEEAAPPCFEHHGRADFLDNAKAAVAQNWQAWLDAAGLIEK